MSSGLVERFEKGWVGGKLRPIGNTVDVKNANWTNTIGAAELGHGLERP